MKYHLLFVLCFCFAASQAQEQQYTIYFKLDSDKPTEESAADFDKWIAANTDIEIYKIEGYADTTGTNQHNFELSVMRTAYVASKLAPKGNFDVRNLGEVESGTGGPENRKVIIVYGPVVATYTLSDPVPAEPVPAPVQIGETELVQQVTAARQGDNLVLRNVGFHGGTDRVLEKSMPALRDLLEIMKVRPSLRIEIQGHICCYPGDVDDLSLRRARAVYRYLVESGISKERLSYKGFGGSRPIYRIPEFSPEEAQANRRVEIQIISL